METEMQIMVKQGSRNIDGSRFLPMKEILSRLPVKSLLRYMSVSKNWKFLISDFSFRKLHHQRFLNNNPPSMLVLHYSCHYRNPVLSTFDIAGELVQQWSLPIVSSNLYMMNFPSQSKLVCFTDRDRFFLCNPSTRRLINLPDPSSYTYFGGFGYVPSRDEYVIVQKTYLSFEILTLSISNDDEQLHYSARRSIDEAMDIRSMIEPWGVFACGAFYWMPIDEDVIISFDTENEVFSTSGLPRDYLDFHKNYMSPLLEIKGELYFMSVIRSWQDTTVQLWKLSDVKNKLWTPSFRINSHSSQRNRYPIEFNIDVLMCRLKHLHYHNKPYKNILRNIRKLRIVTESIKPWGIGIHTNLFSFNL